MKRVNKGSEIARKLAEYRHSDLDSAIANYMLKNIIKRDIKSEESLTVNIEENTMTKETV